MDLSKKDTDGCQDVSKICLELIETVPGICDAKQSLMTHFCQVNLKLAYLKFQPQI